MLLLRLSSRIVPVAVATLVSVLYCSDSIAATHSFELSSIFDASDVPTPSDPSALVHFDFPSFVGDQVATVAGADFSETIGVFRKTPGGSLVETVFEGAINAPSTGNQIAGPVVVEGDATETTVSLLSRDNAGDVVGEIARYTGTANSLTTIVSSNGQLPGTSTNIDNVGFNRYSISNGSVAYLATVEEDTPDERRGLYLSPVVGGSTNTLADTTTSVPGVTPSTMFTGFRFGRSGLENSQAAFAGEYMNSGSEAFGIFTVSPNGAPQPVFLPGDPLPSTTPWPSTAVADIAPAIDDGDVLFRGFSFPNDGLFARLDGALTLIADTGTSLPQDAGVKFTGFSINGAFPAGHALDGGRVLFEGQGDDGSQGIYLWDDGDLSLVLDKTEKIDGLDIFLMDINSESLHGNQILISVLLIDNVAQSAEGRVMLATFGSTADFNGDGSVNSLDLSQWQGDYAINDESDADADGDSDGPDFLAWQQQNTGGATSHVIPEPNSLVLAVAGSIALSLRLIHSTQIRSSSRPVYQRSSEA